MNESRKIASPFCQKSLYRRLGINLFFAALALSTAVNSSAAVELTYQYSDPPLAVQFDVAGGHYNGTVDRGNLFLQTDIVMPPLVSWKKASPGKLYTLMMLDLDGDADGSYPDEVPAGGLAPFRHWIVANIPGKVLRSTGYREGSKDENIKDLSVGMAYRAPHIRLVSDRYGFYLFEQSERIEVQELPVESRMNFDYEKFIAAHDLGIPKAANYMVAIYLSESPFSGKVFQGHDASALWHRDLGKGKLTPQE